MCVCVCARAIVNVSNRKPVNLQYAKLNGWIWIEKSTLFFFLVRFFVRSFF